MVLAKAAGNFTETAIDDEIVVMNLASGDFFSLTGTVREIWLRIDGTLDRAGLIAALARDHSVPAIEIAADVEDFVTQLQDAGLVTGA